MRTPTSVTTRTATSPHWASLCPETSRNFQRAPPPLYDPSTLRLATVFVVVAAGSVLGAGAGFAVHTSLPESPVVRGIYIGERRLPDGASPAQWLSQRQEALSAREVTLLVGDLVVPTTFGELGVEIDVAETLRVAGAIGHEGGMLDRMRAARAAKRGEIDIPIALQLSRMTTTELLKRLAPRVERAAVDARVDIANRRKIPDVSGARLDIESSVEIIERAVASDQTAIELPLSPVLAKVSLDDLVRVDISKVVAMRETKFHTFGTGVGRSVNVRNAAAKIDGIVLAPGQTLSFNEAVGVRTLERGFTWAPEIQGDEMTTGVGGGTCQVSSTLFAAALHATMTIIERQSHSRPSSYAPLGLDATVSWPRVDLKLQNTLPYAVMIHAHFPEDTSKLDDTLRVEILGGAPPADVTYSYGIARSSDFERRVTVKQNLKPGTRIRHQKGTRGFDVTSLVKVRWLDGREETRTYFSGYRPAPEVFWIAPGYDESELPPLPEHCAGNENKTASNASGEDPFAEM